MEAIVEMFASQGKPEISENYTKKTVMEKDRTSSDRCIDCGAPLLHEGGCAYCHACGWSACP